MLVESGRVIVTLLSSGDPAVVADGAGRLRLFAIGRDGVLYHLTQTQPDNGWSGWANLGTPPGVAPADDSSPTAGRVNVIDLLGLGVFMVGSDGALYRRIQQLPDGPWSPWESLGGSINLSAVPVLGAGDINYLFAVGGGVLVENSDLTATTTGPVWSPHPGSPFLFPSPTVGSSADGRLEVLVVNDGELLHQWQLAVAGTNWSTWFSHGPQFGLYAPPVVAAAADGRLEVFAVDNALMLLHKWQTAPNNGWSGWYSHGNPQGLTSGAEGVFPQLAVAAAADGRLELFAIGGSQADPTKDNVLYHIWQTAPNNGWSDWYSHGTPGVSLAPGPRPAVAAAADGRLELFAVGADGALYHMWQTAPNGGWSDWYSHGHP
jgi:hypothetical protein